MKLHKTMFDCLMYCIGDYMTDYPDCETEAYWEAFWEPLVEQGEFDKGSDIEPIEEYSLFTPKELLAEIERNARHLFNWVNEAI